MSASIEPTPSMGAKKTLGLIICPSIKHNKLNCSISKIDFILNFHVNMSGLAAGGGRGSTLVVQGGLNKQQKRTWPFSFKHHQ